MCNGLDPFERSPQTGSVVQSTLQSRRVRPRSWVALMVLLPTRGHLLGRWSLSASAGSARWCSASSGLWLDPGRLRARDTPWAAVHRKSSSRNRAAERRRSASRSRRRASISSNRSGKCPGRDFDEPSTTDRDTYRFVAIQSATACDGRSALGAALSGSVCWHVGTEEDASVCRIVGRVARHALRRRRNECHANIPQHTSQSPKAQEFSVIRCVDSPMGKGILAVLLEGSSC